MAKGIRHVRRGVEAIRQDAKGNGFSSLDSISRNRHYKGEENIFSEVTFLLREKIMGFRSIL